MKKFILAVSLIILGVSVLAQHSASGDNGNGYGACCGVGDVNGFSQTAPILGNSVGCCVITSRDNCLDGYIGEFMGVGTTCDDCCPIEDVSIGEIQPICAGDKGDKVTVTGQVTGPYVSVNWTTSGDGTFDDDTALTTSYTPGSTDIENGSVTLTLTAKSEVHLCEEVTLSSSNGSTQSCTRSSSLLVTINPLPKCTLTLDPDAADGSVLAGSQHTASVPDAGPGAIYEWVIKDENNNSLITSTPPYGNELQWTAPSSGTVKIYVKVTDANGCSCEYDPPIEVLVQIPVPTLSQWGAIAFALLLAGLAVVSFRRRTVG